MNAPRFLILKYVPDLQRFEPKNIGLIIWSPCGVAAKFIGEVNDSGEVNGRSVPGFISSLSAYKQWVRFWRSQVMADAVKPVTGGKPIPRSSPDFVEAIIGTGSGDFLVADGGILLDPVTHDSLNEVTDELYARLVAPTMMPSTNTISADEQRDLALDEICDELLVHK